AAGRRQGWRAPGHGAGGRQRARQAVRGAAVRESLGRAAPLRLWLATWMLLAAPVFGQVEEAREAQNRGVELQRQGDLQGARREFDRVIELVPQSPFGWYNRGLVRRELKDCGGALADFDRAIELDAKFFNALYQRGNCRQALGEYEQALDDYTRALALPGQIRGRFAAYYARGDALRR